jgi:hypothetical protein
MGNEFHGIIIENSLKDPLVLQAFSILSTRTTKDTVWKMHKVAIEEVELQKAVDLLQQNLKEGEPWYVHFYNGERLKIIFRDAVFDAKVADKSTWRKAAEHGSKLKIPQEQLDFGPCRFEDETW